MQTWYMPDGTKTVNKPRDGQIFSRWDSQGNEIEKWQWEGTKDQWINISSGKPNNHNTKTFVFPPVLIDPLELDNWEGESPSFGYVNQDRSSKSECECGSHVVGSPKHSSWCPKFAP